MDLSSTEGLDLWYAFVRQRRVLYALMLRNIRTRFFGNGLGYLIAIAWPLTHILIIVGVFTILGRTPPYGDSIALFVATGVVPFQIFSYVARFMMLSVIKNRPLLAFSEVKVLDIFFASALLEILAASCVAIALIVVAWFAGINAIPQDIVQMAGAFAATILLGIGFGMLNGVAALVVPAWFTGYTLITIVFWATAGIVFVPDALPDTFRAVLAYHPVLQVIEWTRSAYYEGYGNTILNRPYPIEIGGGAVFLGLLFERLVRGHILAWR